MAMPVRRRYVSLEQTRDVRLAAGLLTVGGHGAVFAPYMTAFDAGYLVEAPVFIDAATAAVPAHLCAKTAVA